MPSPRSTVLACLENAAPLGAAEPWDNVGLLLDALGSSEFTRAFITIDLDDETLSEALEQQADLILAYHPPLFSGVKRLRCDDPHEGLLVRALRAGLTIYSPHTALDAASGGMADWLAQALGSGRVRPIVPQRDAPERGAGRFVELHVPLEFEQACAYIKAHLGVETLRVAQAPRGPAQIRSLAVCPGAGGSLFEKVERADLFLTGEMRHHDVLSRRAQGSHVVLTEHTNSERGYLPHFAEALRTGCPGLEFVISQRDRDPLRTI